MKISIALLSLCFALCKAHDAIAHQASFDVQGALDAQQDELKESLSRILGESSLSASKGSKGSKGSKSSKTKGSKGSKSKGLKGKGGSKGAQFSSIESAEYAGSGAVTTGLGYAAATMMVIAAAHV